MLIYFTHDRDMGMGPATEAEYRGALRLIMPSLASASTHSRGSFTKPSSMFAISRRVCHLSNRSGLRNVENDLNELLSQHNGLTMVS
jgi:hypothetical protein